MRKILFIYCLLTACTSPDYLKLGQRKPGLVPQVFAPGFISRDSSNEFGAVLSKDGKEFYFGQEKNGISSILFTRFKNGQWTEPSVLPFNSTYSFNDPFLSNDEQQLFYISNLPKNEQDTTDDYDIWYSNRNGDTWSAPINAGPNINTDVHEYYISFTENGSLCFASNKGKAEKRQHDFDIYIAEKKDGVYQTPIKLSGAVNTRAYEADAFIAPDESYIIFCSFRRSGYGKGDLYISFKDAQGNWQEAVNMGESINTVGHELCPFVTKDGQYFFYTSEQDIYWVKAEILNQFKK